jgi:hypothetical protein
MCVLPLPTTAGPQAFLAAWVSRASSSPRLQTGTPLLFREPFLSMSTSVSRSAGTWVPSVVWTLPLTLRAIGFSVFFGSAFGETVPPKVSLRFPAWTVICDAYAATATPRASTALRASATTSFLRISFSLLCWPARQSPGR